MLDKSKIYFSYFAKTRGIPADQLVSVAVSTPTGFRGIRAFDLAPKWDTVSALKSGRITETQFAQLYQQHVLSVLDPLRIYETYRGKILCCYEKPTSFCHRNLIMSWLKDNLGSDVIGGEI